MCPAAIAPKIRNVVKFFLWAIRDDFKPDFSRNPGSGSNPGFEENYPGFPVPAGNPQSPSIKCEKLHCLESYNFLQVHYKGLPRFNTVGIDLNALKFIKILKCWPP